MEKDPVLENLTQITANALKDLEFARQELQENDMHMKEMNKLANKRVEEMSRVNQQLQNKISFVENMTKSIQEKNDKLEKEIETVNKEKNNYQVLNTRLKKDLGNIMLKEKELSIKQTFLEKTIEKQSENLAKTEKMAIIGQFTSRLAHDIRNPLTQIQMSHEILSEKPKLNVLEKVKHQQRIQKAITKITHIVEDVLEFVRMSDLTLKETSLKDVLDSSLESIDISSTVNLENMCDDTSVFCDPRKLEAVFTNLITNALDAINNSGYIRISVLRHDQSIEIIFEDSGQGVPPELESKIFDSLFTTKSHGNGLGLAISKLIVEQHGGKLAYKNHPSSFSVILPNHDHRVKKQQQKQAIHCQ